jgi:hypothetical protein
MAGEDEEVVIRHTRNRLRLLGKADPERAEELEREGETRARIVKCRFGGEEDARERGKEREWRYEVKINENRAIGLLKEQFVRLMREDDDEKKERMFIRESGLIPRGLPRLK